MAKLTAQINADASQFLDVIKQVLKSAEQAQQAIQSAFGDSSKVEINDSAIKDALDATEKLSKELKSMSGKVDVNDSEIDSAAKKVKQIDGSEANVTVNADTSALDGISDAFSGSVLGGLLGGGISGLVETGIGAIVGGFSDAIAKGNEFNSALGDLQAKTGATKEEFTALKKASEDAFIGGVGESVAEATNIIANAQVRFGDLFDPKELSDFTIGAQALGNTFDMDVNDVLTKSEVLVKQYGLTGKEAFDTISLALQGGSSGQDDILDSLNEYAPAFRQAGFSALEFTETLNRGAELGVFNTDKIGDAVKEAQIRINAGDFSTAFDGLTESAKKSGVAIDDNVVKAFDEIKNAKGAEKGVADTVEAILQKAKDGKITIKQALQESAAEVQKGLDSGKISESFASSIQVAVAGTPAEDLGVELYGKIFGAPLDEKAIAEKAKLAGKSVSGAIGQYTSFESISRQFELFITKLSQGFIAFSDKVIAPIIGGLISILGGIKGAFDDVFGDFEGGAGMMEYFDALIGVFNIIVGIVRDEIGAVFRIVFGTIKGIFESITTAISPIVDYLIELFDTVSEGGGFFEDFGEILSDVGDVLGMVGGFIVDLLLTPMELMIDLTIDIVKWVTNFIAGLFGVGDAGKFFSTIIDRIGNALTNVKGTIGGVIAAFKAFKEAIKSLDFSKVVSDLLSGKNPFASIGDSLSNAYDDGFNKATGKVKDETEKQAEYQSALFNQINAQISDLASRKDQLSNQELANEKKRIDSLITLNVNGNALIKTDAKKLSNALGDIKLKTPDLEGAKKEGAKLLDYYNTDFKEKLKAALNLADFNNELQLSDSFIDVEGILNGFKKPIEDFRTAITGIRISDNQLDTIKSFVNDLSDAITATNDLKNNLEQTPQYLKNLVGLTGDLSSEFGKYANETDKTLSKLKTELSDLQFSFNTADTEQAQTEILSKLLSKYNEYNSQVIKTANVSATDRKKLEENLASDLSNLQVNAKGLTEAEINKQLDALRKELDGTLKIQQDKIDKQKDAENGLISFLEERRIDGIEEINEKEKTKEIKALDDKYKELIKRYGINDESVMQLREAFEVDRLKIVEKYTVKESNLYQDLANKIKESYIAFDASNVIKQNKDVENSINGVTTKYKEDSDALKEQLNNKTITSREYNEKIIELEKAKNDSISKLEGDRVKFTDILNSQLSESFSKLAKDYQDSFKIKITATLEFNDKLKDLQKQLAEGAITEAEYNELSVKTQKDKEAALTESYNLIGVASGAMLGQMLVDGESFTTALAQTALSGLQSLIPIFIAEIFGQSIGTLGPIAGPITAGLLTVALQSLVGIAQASIGGANDGIIGLTEGNKGKPKGRDSILMMLAPNESVITAEGTAKNKHWLDLANKGFSLDSLINPQLSFNGASTSMTETNNRLDETNRKLDILTQKFGTMKVNHFHDKQPKVNINNVIQIKSRRGTL